MSIVDNILYINGSIFVDNATKESDRGRYFKCLSCSIRYLKLLDSPEMIHVKNILTSKFIIKSFQTTLGTEYRTQRHLLHNHTLNAEHIYLSSFQTPTCHGILPFFDTTDEDIQKGLSLWYQNETYGAENAVQRIGVANMTNLSPYRVCDIENDGYMDDMKNLS